MVSPLRASKVTIFLLAKVELLGSLLTYCTTSKLEQDLTVYGPRLLIMGSHGLSLGLVVSCHSKRSGLCTLLLWLLRVRLLQDRPPSIFVLDASSPGRYVFQDVPFSRHDSWRGFVLDGSHSRLSVWLLLSQGVRASKHGSGHGLLPGGLRDWLLSPPYGLPCRLVF